MRPRPNFQSILLITLPLLAASGTFIWDHRTTDRSARLQKAGHGGAVLSSGLAPVPFVTPHDRYQCPMHPQIIMDHPGDCPICHMHLQMIDDDGASSSLQAQPAAGIPGKAGFTLSQERQQLIGVRSAVAQVVPLALTLRMPGRVLSPGRVSAQLLEIDAGSLKAGMKAHLQGPHGASAEATIISVANELDNASRSFAVTLRSTSPAAWMRKGLFCEVSVDVDLGEHLAVPQEAVLDTGERQVLFVVDGQGHLTRAR